ncbi:hypothetical protein CVV67_28605 [Arthrobacter stackebrandtii]|nr:hypothetical protein CVV67_28605 [Arthrobacter stackebrandtii]
MRAKGEGKISFLVFQQGFPVIVKFCSETLGESRPPRPRCVGYRRDRYIRQTLQSIKIERGVPVADFQENDFQTSTLY